MTRPTILVVEDDDDSREMLGWALEMNGYRSVLASDGAAALEVLDHEHPSVILLDLMMPRMNGWQFRERQLQDERYRSIPVVILSAVSQTHSPAAVKAFIQKPVKLEEVLATLESLCQQSDGACGRDDIAHS